VRSRPEMALLVAGLVGAGSLSTTIAAAVADAPLVARTAAASAGKAARPDEAQIVAAVAKLRTDPNLATERKIRTLRWVGKMEERPPSELPTWLSWIAELFAWLAEAGRLLLWVVCLLVIGLLAVYFTRFIRSRGERAARKRFVAPSHVRDLDIRPESLPDDIGAAAMSLWESGEHRAALSLLYRGLLSRLAHAHAVPIRNSSTEGECLVLALRHLQTGRSAYVTQLIRIWQRAVYGKVDPAVEDVRALCVEFRPALDPGPDADFAGHSA